MGQFSWGGKERIPRLVRNRTILDREDSRPVSSRSAGMWAWTPLPALERGFASRALGPSVSTPRMLGTRARGGGGASCGRGR